MGFEPTGYEEIWIERAGTVQLVPLFPGQTREALLKAGTAPVKAEARMAVRFSEVKND
jgi:hypothetical protein